MLKRQLRVGARIAALSLLGLLLMGAAPKPPAIMTFVGKYPFDKVRGVSFLNHPLVRRAVRSAVFEDSVSNEVLDAGVSGPITRRGSLVISSACRPHDCADVNWTVAILVPRGPAAVCYHNAELMGEQSRWFIGGFSCFRAAGGCDSDAVPATVVAAIATAG